MPLSHRVACATESQSGLCLQLHFSQLLLVRSDKYIISFPVPPVCHCVCQFVHIPVSLSIGPVAVEQFYCFFGDGGGGGNFHKFSGCS